MIWKKTYLILKKKKKILNAYFGIEEMEKIHQ